MASHRLSFCRPYFTVHTDKGGIPATREYCAQGPDGLFLICQELKEWQTNVGKPMLANQWQRWPSTSILRSKSGRAKPEQKQKPLKKQRRGFLTISPVPMQPWRGGKMWHSAQRPRTRQALGEKHTCSTTKKNEIPPAWKAEIEEYNQLVETFQIKIRPPVKVGHM